MPQIITNTAELSCNQGTATSKLNVTSQDFVTIEDKAMATEEDKQANANILPFKQCKLKPSSGGYLPCVPAPIQWEEAAEKDTINERKIAGKIIVCPNSNGLEDTITHQIVNHRKELNVVLVQVKTKPDGVIIFNDDELVNVRKYLSQGLINVTFIDGDIMSINGREEKKPFELNVSRDNRFITGGRNLYINSGGKLIGEPHPILKELFNAQTNNTYANDFIVFAFDIEGENYRGNAESIGGRTLIVTSDRDSVTLSHELLHCLGLYHTHQDFEIIIINRNTPNSSTVFKPNKRNNSGCLYVSKTDGSLWLYKNRRYINYDPYLFEEQIKQNKKYIFNHGNIKQRLSTYNIMSYNSIRFYLWHWQWEIINKNII